MRTVGLDRFLKGQWLDKTLEIMNTESDVSKIRKTLEQYLKQMCIRDRYGALLDSPNYRRFHTKLPLIPQSCESIVVVHEQGGIFLEH